jgi:metal-responsive CopG/Arc/MetJ family transcriptional regulator
MKTAVSIPDKVFERVERLAKRTKRSRSRIFSDALDEYLARHTSDEITERMNTVILQEPEASDAFVAAAARRVLERSDW